MERDAGSPPNPLGGAKDGEFTLESILAEYKGSSYIEGERKTPKDVLDEKARRIVREESGDAPPADEPAEPAPPPRAAETFDAEDKDLAFFENYTYASASPDEEIVRSVTEAIEGGAREPHGRALRRPAAREAPETEAEAREEDEPEEPDYRERARQYAARCNSLSGRVFPALALSAFIAVLTLIFEGGGVMPFGIGRNIFLARGVLLIGQLAVMLLGADVLIRGAKELLNGRASADTLAFASCAVSVLSGIHDFRSVGETLPYSALSAFSLAFALWGERVYTHTLADTLRLAAATREPYSVVSEYRRDLEKIVLKKTAGKRLGFYNNLREKDICETAYGYASPLLLIFCVVISLYAALAHRSAAYIPAMLAATTAVSAAFTSTTAFAAPLRSAARRAKEIGAAIAGAGGADDIFYIDGCCVSDGDIYPPDTLEIGGIRILDQVTPEKAIRYTAGLVIASGSCLAGKFTEILAAEGMGLIAVRDFDVSEGGVSGMIHGESVIAGNYAFMNLHGVRVPDELKLGNSVYTAVGKRLIAMFSVDYKPSGVIRDAMLRVLRYCSRLFLTVRDFNITPMTIEQRFKIPMEDFEILPIRSTYELADESREGRSRAAAICGRGGLPEFGELISAARKIKIISQIMTIITVVSSVWGALMMAFRVWSGGADAARPGGLLLFMLVPPVISAALEIIMGLRRKNRR